MRTRLLHLLPLLLLLSGCNQYTASYQPLPAAPSALPSYSGTTKVIYVTDLKDPRKMLESHGYAYLGTSSAWTTNSAEQARLMLAQGQNVGADIILCVVRTKPYSDTDGIISAGDSAGGVISSPPRDILYVYTVTFWRNPEHPTLSLSSLPAVPPPSPEVSTSAPASE